MKTKAQNSFSMRATLALIVLSMCAVIPSFADSVATRFDSTTTVALPDMSATDSPINVSGISGQIVGVRVAVHLTHTSDSDLIVSLIAPDGTTAILANRRGGSAENFGSSCTVNPPWDSRTIFDDGASTAIGSGTPPFAGKFKPEQALSVFNGKTGSAVNGAWKLRVTDNTGADVGAIDCWTLWLWSCGTSGGCSTDLRAYWTVYFYNYFSRHVTGRIGVRNDSGDGTGKPVTVRFFLSADNVLDPNDAAIPGTYTVDPVSYGGVKFVTFSNVTAPVDPAGKYVIAVVDPGEEVREIDRSNNLVVGGPLP